MPTDRETYLSNGHIELTMVRDLNLKAKHFEFAVGTFTEGPNGEFELVSSQAQLVVQDAQNGAEDAEDRAGYCENRSEGVADKRMLEHGC